jgi:hypothetical protein
MIQKDSQPVNHKPVDSFPIEGLYSNPPIHRGRRRETLRRRDGRRPLRARLNVSRRSRAAPGPARAALRPLCREPAGLGLAEGG